MSKLLKHIIPCVLLTAGIFISIYSKDYYANYNRISDSEFEIKFEVKNLRTETINKDGTLYTDIVFDDAVRTNRKGYAEVPMLNATVRIGGENNVIIASTDGEYNEIRLEHPLIPSRGVIYRNQDPGTIPYSIDPKSVTDAWYPENIVEVTEPFIFRDVRGLIIYSYPIQYNSSSKTVRIYKSITVNMKEDFTKSTNPISKRPENVDTSINQIYKSLFINYDEIKFENQVGETGGLLVIYTSRDSLAIQPYIDWKKQKGFKVNSIKVLAGTNVKTTIQDAYDSDPNLLYIQLVGDWADIQCDLGGGASAPTDPMLGCVSGSDLFPELIVGRFSAESANDVTIQVNKTIAYEKTPELSGTWYSKGLGIGSPEGDGIGDDEEIDYVHIDVIKENKLLPFTYETVYEAYSNPSANTVANYINSGLGVINYCGHGSLTSWGTSGYSNININNSTNGSRLPFIFSVACVNGAFHSGTCFAEAWLRKSGGGAVATLMSTINQPWVPPMRGQDYMNDILAGGYNYSINPGSGTSTTTADQRTTYGSIAMNGSVLMLAEQYGDISTKETIQTWTIFGDASLQVRTDTPKLIENTNGIIFPESYTTRIVSTGEPVDGAIVTLFQNGSNYTGVTDANGDVTILHDFVGGDVLVTVSGFNLETIQDALSVQPPEGPYLKVKEYSFSSTYSGETVNADMSITNIGFENSENISILVSSESQYISMINDNYSFPSAILEPDSVVFSNNNISFKIDPFTPDQERIKLLVTISDSYTKRSYASGVYITVGSPILNITHSSSTLTIVQGQPGTVVFRIENLGHAPILDLTAVLEQISAFDVLITDPVPIVSIGAGSFAEASFICYYGQEIPNSSYIMYNLSVDSQAGFSLDYKYETVVGLTEGFESGDFSENGWSLSGGDSEWIIDSNQAYEGNFSANSGVVGDDEKSSLAVSFNFRYDGNISFYRKISSENNYDKLNFYIDGIFKKSWSGILDWTKVTLDVEAGIHDFKWEFERDRSLGAGSNCAWIDNVLATGIDTGIESADAITPEIFCLYQNFPNPFNPVTQISFDLEISGEVNLSVFNISGQKVFELASGIMRPGFHSVEFDGSRLNSGVYYYTLKANGRTGTKKMIMIK